MLGSFHSPMTDAQRNRFCLPVWNLGYVHRSPRDQPVPLGRGMGGRRTAARVAVVEDGESGCT